MIPLSSPTRSSPNPNPEPKHAVLNPQPAPYTTPLTAALAATILTLTPAKANAAATTASSDTGSRDTYVSHYWIGYRTVAEELEQTTWLRYYPHPTYPYPKPPIAQSR